MVTPPNRRPAPAGRDRGVHVIAQGVVPVQFSRFALVALLAAGGLVPLGACSDPAGTEFPALIASDSLLLAVPGPMPDVPSAVDITVQLTVQGGRFPERQSDADRWDFALRERAGALVLLPAGALGIENRAGITAARAGQTLETLREVPSQTRFITDEAVPLQAGNVHITRSRLFGTITGSCQQFGKLEVMSVDPAARTARLRVVTNQNCGDPRLVAE
jgi:hypothetical protein